MKSKKTPQLKEWIRVFS